MKKNHNCFRRDKSVNKSDIEREQYDKTERDILRVLLKFSRWVLLKSGMFVYQLIDIF